MPAIKINAAAQAAFAAFVAVSNTATVTLREALLAAGFDTVEKARPQALAFVAAKYDIAIVESKSPFNRGELVLDRSAPNFVTAKQALIRLTEALAGDADAEASASESTEAEPSGAMQYEIPEEIAALAAQLVAACREYDGMTAKQQKSLAAQAIAKAFKAK